MSKRKLLHFFFGLFIALSVIFCILLIVQDTRDDVDVLGRISLWCGLVSQLLLALSMYLEIRKDKKNENG
jgi:hypothetical protein